MEQINNLLEARKKYLLKIKKEKEQELINASEGFLRVSKHREKTQYYHRNNPKDTSGVYIREEDLELARRLVQKDYDTKILRSSEKELAAIEKYLLCKPMESVEQIYEKLHPARQKLICPIAETEAQYIYNWENVEYQGKEFNETTPPIYTAKGERVRSKSEIIIADSLNRAGVPYRYEYPIHLGGWGKIYPDFTVLNIKKRQELYWEHFGMMDDADYVEKALMKIMLYEENNIFPGVNLILTYETKQNPINQKIVRLLIEQYLV